MKPENKECLVVCNRILFTCVLCFSFGFLRGEEPQSEPDRTPPETAPIVKPGVVLEIEVLASGDIEVPTTQKRVSDDGMISLPLVGDVKVVNLTLNQLQDELRKRYLKYLRKPQILLEFILDETSDGVSPFGHVTVLGRVKKPGWVKIPPTRHLTVARAIQQAGGFATSARSSSIKVTRKGENKKTKSFTVNLKALGSKGDFDGDIPLKAGDVVYVPEQMW